MPANAGYIHIPIEIQVRLQGEWNEFDKAKQVYRRKSRQDRRMKGRILEVQNVSILDRETSKKKYLSPLQVACLWLSQAKHGHDVIRVVTDVDMNLAGSKVEREIDFSVDHLVKTMVEEPAFFPDVIGGKITMEDEAVNNLPQHWAVNTDAGIFAPTV